MDKLETRILAEKQLELYAIIDIKTGLAMRKKTGKDVAVYSKYYRAVKFIERNELNDCAIIAKLSINGWM